VGEKRQQQEKEESAHKRIVCRKNDSTILIYLRISQRFGRPYRFALDEFRAGVSLA